MVGSCWILHHLRTMVEATLLVGIYRGIESDARVSQWRCETDFATIHSMCHDQNSWVMVVVHTRSLVVQSAYWRLDHPLRRGKGARSWWLTRRSQSPFAAGGRASPLPSTFKTHGSLSGCSRPFMVGRFPANYHLGDVDGKKNHGARCGLNRPLVLAGIRTPANTYAFAWLVENKADPGKSTKKNKHNKGN